MKADFEAEAMYNQLCVFDTSLQQPYNDWSDQHVMQGFAWRPGSVSFAMPDDGPIQLTVLDRESPQAEPVDAFRVIRVPFKQTSLAVEIGSVMMTDSFRLPPGEWNLLFYLMPSDDDRYVNKAELHFTDGPPLEAEVIRHDSLLAPTKPLRMTADPA